MHRIKTRQSRARRLLCFTLGVSTSLVAQANPQGPAVAAGNVSFANPNATTLDITNSPNAIINWQSFDIGVGETTRFIQQDAASGVLNRVTTPNASEILGSLVSNGRVFLVNPSGIVIGRDGMVDTAGLVMSTLDITNEDFLAGRFEFNGGPDSGNITNHGYIRTTPGGEVVLLAPRILNAPEAGNPQSGIIESENGELILAAGYSITITSLDDPDISFDVAAPAGEVVNLGQLIARGGSVEVLADTIRHSGEINADALSVDDTGRIVLSATKTIETTADSVISARGEQLVASEDAAVAALNPVGADGGDVTVRALAPVADPDAVPTADAATPAPTSIALAGRIDVSGARGGQAVVEADVVTVKGTIDASGKTAGGTVHVLGDAVKAEAATLRANADSGNAGDIRFGGELRGAATLRAADTADVDAASRFEANASTRGDGGEIIVWSNDETMFRGTAEARAGAEAGDGGMVEVSGKEILRFAGSVDVGAPRGKAGTLLLDPRNIFIVQGGATVSVDNPTPFSGDGFGSSFSVLGNGNILVINQDANAAGLTDAGEITLLDSNGNVLGSVTGNAADERLGSFGSFTGTDGNRFFRSPDASNGGLTDAGALILFNISTGTEIGRTSGLSAGERFSQGSLQFASGNLVVSSTLADVGGNVDAGSVVVVNGTTGTELGRLNGTSASEFFGTTVRVGFTAANTFVVQSATADIGGLVDAGRVVMGSSLTGQQLGQVVGGTAGDQIGSTVDYFSTGAGTYLIRSATADVGGLVDAGTAILVNNSTGSEIGRVSGQAAGDNLGSFGPILRSSGNYFLQIPNADPGAVVNAGSLFLVNGTSGTLIAQLNGTGTGELLSQQMDFSLGGGDAIVISELHDNPGIGTVDDEAGAIFVVADVDLGSFTFVRGGTLGQSAGEQFGSNGIEAFTTGGMIIISENADTGGFTDNGSVVLVGLNGVEVNRVDGTDDNEQLGSDGIIQAFNGNYWIPSTQFAPIPSTPNVGSVILASGTTGAALGRFDGTATNEQFGSDLFDGELFNGDLLVRSTGHAAGNGVIAQLAPVDLGSGVILRNRVDGLSAGDFLGSDINFLPGGNYVVSAPNWNDGGNNDAGRVFVVDGSTGATLGTPVTGNNVVETLGSNLEFDLFQFDLGGSVANHFAILSQGHGGNSEGAVFFVDGATGALLRQIDGNTSDTLGGEDLELVPGSHIAVRNPFSDTGGANAGEILFVDPFAGYTTSGSALGISAGELLGDSDTEIDTSSLSGLFNGMFLIHTPNRDVSGNADAGAVLIMQGSFNSAVTLQGAISGLEAQDRLGENGASDVQLLTGNRFVLFNEDGDDPTGTPGDGNNEGAVILASTTLFSEIGRFYGQTDDNENLGSVGFVTERPNGNFFIHSPGAGANSGGALYLASGSTGVDNLTFDDILIGRADGTAPSENFGSNLDTFTLTNGDVLVRSQTSSAGGFANGGTVVQIVSDASLGGGNLVRGRIDGSSAGELLGQFGATASGDGVHYFVRSQLADPGGLADAGSIYFVNQTTGTLANRIDGISANEQLGNGSPFLGSAGNFFLRSQQADVGGAVDAGRLLVVSRAGAILGEATGNTASEFFGSSFQFIGNDIWVTATGHSNGAGGIFAIANQDLGGGNIIRSSLLGGAAGDALGSLGFSFIDADSVLVRVPLADVGGLVDAGSALMVNTSLQLLGRTDGTSANELYGTNLQFLSNDNLLFRSPNADIGGLSDAGVVKVVDPNTGNLIGQTAGTSANERFGDNFAISLGNNGFAIVSENADSGGLVDAGAVVQISADTGLEIQRIVGTSAGEQLGSFGFQTSAGRLIFGSPLADVGGITDAGRIVIFDPTTANQGGQATNLLFSNTPDGDFVLTTGAIQNALNGGANLILQSNNDIVIQKGAVLTATGGSLTLNAGRSVIVHGLLNMKDTDITILANQNQAGVSLDNRDSGTSEFALFDPQVIGRNVEITADLVSLTGGDVPVDGSAPLAWDPISSTDFFENVLREGTAYPATFVLGTQSLTVTADTINLNGGTAPGAFAALVSFGDFSVDTRSITLTPGTEPGAHALFLGLGGVGEFTFDTCEGCGNELLFTDPFLSGGAPVSGFFISGILQNPAIDGILAMLDRDEDDEEEKKKRCN